MDKQPQVPKLDMTQVQEYQRRFKEVFAQGTNKERREFARLFVKKIEFHPDTFEVVMCLYGRPPGIRQNKTPVPSEDRVQNGLVAGAGFGDNHNGLTAEPAKLWTPPQ